VVPPPGHWFRLHILVIWPKALLSPQGIPWATEPWGSIAARIM